MPELKVGDPAPEFTLPDETGKPVSLADFRGKRVVLFFYPRDNTPGCTAQACGFRGEFSAIQDKNAVVLTDANRYGPNRRVNPQGPGELPRRVSRTARLAIEGR